MGPLCATFCPMLVGIELRRMIPRGKYALENCIIAKQEKARKAPDLRRKVRL